MRSVLWACILAVSVVVSVAPARASAPEIYQRLAQNLQKGEIRIDYELSDRAASGAGVRLLSARGGSGTAHVTFDNGKLIGARITFAPRVRIAFKKQPERWLSTLTFDAAGRAASAVVFDAADANDPVELTPDVSAPLFKALSINADPAQLLAGRLFKYLGSPCDAWQPCSRPHLVRSIRWSTGTNVLLKPTTLVFSKQDAEGCAELDIADNAAAMVLEASLDLSTEPSSRTALVRASMSGVVLRGGCFGVDRTKFRVALTGGSASIEELVALRTKTSDSVTVRIGDGQLALGKGELQLAQDTRIQSSVVTSAGTLVLGHDGGRIEIENDRTISFSFGADTELQLEVSKGTLGLWTNSFTTLGVGKLTLPITTAVWRVKGVPLLVADQDAVEFDLELGVGGVIRPNSDSRLPLLGGHLKASNASFDSQAGARFFGTFGKATFDTAVGSRFVAPGGFVVDGFTVSTKLDLDDPAQPLKLERLGNYPAARFKFKGRSKLISSASDQAVSCEEGTYDVDVYLAPQTVALRGPLHCKGEYHLKPLGNDMSLSADLVIEELRLSPPSRAVSGKGTFSVTLPAGAKGTFQTEGKREPTKEAKTFLIKTTTTETKAVTLSLETRGAITVASPFELVEGKLDFTPADQVLPIAVSVPQDQEVASIDLDLEVGGTCIYHIGAKAGTYATNATLRVKIQHSAVEAWLTSLSDFSPRIGHTESGCEGLKIAAGLIALLIDGFPTLVGAAVTFELLQDALINRMISDKTHEFSKKLVDRQLPPALIGLPTD